MLKKINLKRHFWLLGGPIGAVGLPLVAIAIYHLLFLCFAGLNMRRIILWNFEGSLRILYAVVVNIQAPAGITLGACTAIVVQLVRSHSPAAAMQVSFCGGFLVGLFFSYWLYWDVREVQDLWAMMPLFGLPIMWSVWLVGYGFLRWLYFDKRQI